MPSPEATTEAGKDHHLLAESQGGRGARCFVEQDFLADIFSLSLEVSPTGLTRGRVHGVIGSIVIGDERAGEVIA